MLSMGLFYKNYIMFMYIHSVHTTVSIQTSEDKLQSQFSPPTIGFWDSNPGCQASQ